MAQAPKHSRFLAVLMIQKLGALRVLLRHIELAQLPRERPAPGEIAALLERLVDDSLPNWQRAAAGLLLDYYSPDWRKDLPAELLGWIVERDDMAVRHWRAAVLCRDGYACRDCAGRDELEAHHIVRWADAPALRVDEDNGLTLCAPCHKRRHAS